MPHSVRSGIIRALTIEGAGTELKTIQDIERAINALPPQQLAELYAWLDLHRPVESSAEAELSVFAQGLGLFGSPADTRLLDEVVQLAYDERRRPSRPPDVL